MALPAFESHGGRLEAFEDGHCPETFRFPQHQEGDGKNDGDRASIDEETPRIVRYDCQQATSIPSTQTAPSSNVHIYDDVLNTNHARMLYKVTSSGPRDRPTGATVKESLDLDQTGQTIKLEGESPWGTYVTIKETLEWIEWNKEEGQSEQCQKDTFDEYVVAWRKNMVRFCNWQRRVRKSLEEKKEERLEQCNEKESSIPDNFDDMDNVRHALAVEAVAKFFIETVPSKPGEVASAHPGQSKDSLFRSSQIIQQAHGVAVWALSSNPGHSVQYHIDYAELLRYEYNVTVPPLWAGTIQCSSLWNDQRCWNNDNKSSCNNLQQQRINAQNCMKGGEFCVNLRGLEHYREHGYKGNLSGDPMGRWRRPDNAININSNCLKGGVQINGSNQWVTIPYSFNRGIVHVGELPHLSAPIESIGNQNNNKTEKDHSCESSNLSRVIVGFNVFGHDVGARIAKAPEHSKPFRRKVRLYRSTINASVKEKKSAGGKSYSGGMDLSQIRKNKGLTKLLVLAKREKVKEELRCNQEKLSCKIWRRLISHHVQDRPLLQLSSIVEEFGHDNDSLSGAWPKSIDVHVHLHHMLLSKSCTKDKSHDGSSQMSNLFQDHDGLIGRKGTWYCIKVVSDTSSSSDLTAENDDEHSSSGLISLSSELDIYEY